MSLVERLRNRSEYHAADLIEELADECDTLRNDAARYRYLRDVVWLGPEEATFPDDMVAALTAADVDAAIDAAIANPIPVPMASAPSKTGRETLHCTKGLKHE